VAISAASNRTYLLHLHQLIIF